MKKKDPLISYLVAVGFFITVTCSVIPKASHNSRPIDKPLSDEVHFEAENKEEHNVEYDHDAFLGRDEAKSFDQLTPTESKRRLGIIFEKIDKNQDGLVTPEELQQWIRFVQKRYVESETSRQWLEHFENHPPESASELRWSDYLKRTYGTSEDELAAEKVDDPEYVENENKIPIARDRRRWEAADMNQNGHLTKEEFMYFVHPEEADHTKDVVIDETIEDIDKDHDGFISLQEYMDDTIGDDDDEENDPSWIAEEEEDFHEELDKDRDGRLNRDEVAHWVIPNDYDHSLDETNHLFSKADSDKDGVLIKSEVVEKYDLFVGSQATDYGEVLTKHEEF